MSSPLEGEGEDLLNQAKRLLESGYKAEACDILERFLQSSPVDLHVSQITRMGRLLADAGELPRAIAIAELGLSKAPHSLEIRRTIARMNARYYVAHSSEGIEPLKRAEAHLSVYLNERPSDARAHALLGWVVERQGRGQEAVECWRCAQVLDPSELDYRMGLGMALCFSGRFREAIPHFKMVAASQGERADVHINLGVACREAGELEQAVAILEKARSLRPRYPRILVDLGLCYRRMGRLALATETLEEATRLAPEHSDSYNQLGQIYIRVGRFQEASLALGKARELDPHNLQIQRSLLDLARIQGMVDDDDDTLAAPLNFGSHLRVDISHFSVPDIVEFLGLGRRTGMLDVHTTDIKGELEFIEGKLLFGRLQGQPTGSELLMFIGCRMPSDFARLESERGLGPILEAVSDLGGKEREQVIEIAYEASVRTLLALLQANAGAIEFRARDPGRPGQSPRLLDFCLTTQAVLLEALRRYDERVFS